MWKKVNNVEELKIGDQIRYIGLSGTKYGFRKDDSDARFVKSIAPFCSVDSGGREQSKVWPPCDGTCEVFVPDCIVPNTLGVLNARQMDIMMGLRSLIETAHGASVESGWWNDLYTGQPIQISQEVVGDKLMLIVTEIAEAKEGYRKDLKDDHLPHRKMVEVELADAVIRIADLAGALDLDIGAAVVEKMRYNASRADHKIENRKKQGGKKT